MSKSQNRNTIKKKRMKIFRKVKNSDSIGSVIASFLLLFSVSALFAFIGGFFVEYVLESKFSEEYSKIYTVAKIYEEGKTNGDILTVLNKTPGDFIIEDASGNRIFSKGKDTCSTEKNDLVLSNGTEGYIVYKDTENDFLFPKNNGNTNLNLREFWDMLDKANEDSLNLPLWISVDAGGGEQLIGKAVFSFRRRDIVLMGEIVAAVATVVVALGIIMLISIITAFVKSKRVKALFYEDFVTRGKNWNYYLVYGDKRIHGALSKKKNFAAVNLIFNNYRNYCLCHSIAEGEEYLSKVNIAITRELGSDEICAHATTSNFALLLRYEDEDSLMRRLRGLVDRLTHIEDGHNFKFRAGACLLPADGTRRKDIFVDDIYNNACAAQAAISDSDDNPVKIFGSSLLDEQKWENTVQERQWAALKNEEFKVYYQPKYDPRNDTLKGAEALIRWQFSENEIIPPGRFIPLFEKNGFITEIDHYMIAHVARDQKAWLDKGLKCVPVSVNVSRAHFVEKDLANQIARMVDEAGCPHELIEIELTESAFFDDKDAMIQTINQLKSNGFSVSMDDFGAGYSSLNSLKDMPLDVLKLDAEFFRGEDAGERGEIVVSEAINLAKKLKMRTVAEGVEEKEQVDFLAGQGCDMIQGYFYSKPVPKSEYETYM